MVAEAQASLGLRLRSLDGRGVDVHVDEGQCEATAAEGDCRSCMDE